MGRELRMVPPDWEHPRDENTGRHKPLHDGKDYRSEAAKWIADCAAWDNGTHPAVIENPKRKESCRYFWDWAGDPPHEDDYMLVDVPMSERTHFMLYQTTSEGSPCNDCPAFATLDELCEWAEKHATTFASFTASAAEWKKMLSEDFVHVEQKIPGGPTLVFI